MGACRLAYRASAAARTSSPICCVTGSVARCGRTGAYGPETLAARFGDMALPDVLIALTGVRAARDFSAPPQSI
jgi:hypothetical protein